MGLAELFNSNQKKPLEEITSDLKTIIQDLLRVNGKIQVFVFGSVAKGEANKTSDYDIAVVIEDSVDKKHFIK